MDVYEVMFIIIPELDEEQVENTISRFRTVIERTSGEPRDVNHWGRRKLASLNRGKTRAPATSKHTPHSRDSPPPYPATQPPPAPASRPTTPTTARRTWCAA